MPNAPTRDAGPSRPQPDDPLLAEERYRRALEHDPNDAKAEAGLALLLARKGDLDAAKAHFRRALELRPDFVKAHHNLGVALAEGGEWQAACASFAEAIRLAPGYPEAHYNLGNTLRQGGKREEAVEHFRSAVAARPSYADALNNLGLTLVELGRPHEAVAFLEQAVRLRPGQADALNNLGLALADLGRFPEAEAAYRRALDLQPGFADAHSNLANAFKEQGRFAEALAGYELSLWIDPGLASARWNRSLTWLQMGDYERGWPEYEWRWRRPRTRPRPFAQPRWDGSPLEGRTLLLWSEQGLGDMIQFLRYAPFAKERGGEVLVECPGELAPLFSRCRGIDRLVVEGDPLGPYDVQAPLMSLPALLGTTLSNVPARAPYLSPDPGLAEAWAKRLSALPGFKVGIAWQGNPRNRWDRHRSAPLAEFAPLARCDGVRLVSLQKGFGSEQLPALAGSFPVIDLGPELDAGGAFLDTAAVIGHLDLVVTVDSALAHLAGALGAPVWVALAEAADWRWLRGREDSPWYPTARLFRQQRLGEWRGVFGRMAEELKVRAARAAGVTVPVCPGELLDKITILEIKKERITDPAKRRHVVAELAALEAARERVLPVSEELAGLVELLREVNRALWDVEDELRRCELRREFGPAFVELARSVYRDNDRRAQFKRRVNVLCGSALVEEKLHPAYGEESPPPDDGVGARGK